MIKLKQILLEGGLGGHIKHPYEIINNGPELINLFNNIIKSINQNNASVKFDGANASIRYNGKEFVLDRGSAKPLDISGTTIRDLSARFINKKNPDKPHPFIKIGEEVLSFFNNSKNYCKSELNELGILSDPNLLLNIEYINSSDSNVIKYNKNYFIIHGIKKVTWVTFHKVTGEPRSRGAVNYDYDYNILERYIEKLNQYAQKNNINVKVFGKVKVNQNSNLNINIPLHKTLKLYPTGESVKKSIGDWLKEVSYKPDIKFTKSQFIQALNSKNIEEEFGSENYQDVLNITILILGSIIIGSYIINNTNSDEFGDMKNHEGIVINDKSISDEPIKITGTFYFRAMMGNFAS